MTRYELLKLTHVFCVFTSAALFAYRFLLIRRHPTRLLTKPLKIVPHINDTVLLAAAVGMLVLIDLNPFKTQWLLVKIVLLLGYIALGAACLRSTPRTRRQSAFFIAAMSVFTYIVFVAMSKQVLPN